MYVGRGTIAIDVGRAKSRLESLPLITIFKSIIFGNAEMPVNSQLLVL
jgi:hypothetical protein